ncbi:MAG: hypothetical protein H7X93_04100 [Sphingomonadaceae bacterium]|nr:hypothetical protein [Sphingomonadaceae bacterium]
MRIISAKGAGSDWADYSSASDKVKADLKAPGSNTGDAAGDVYVSIEHLRGTGFKDVLLGDDFANRIEGLAKNDNISGRDGNDTLAGGAGKDTLKGGAGADRFVLASVNAADADKISDFASGDRIELDSALYGLPVGALPGNRFVTGTAAGDGNDRIIYNDANGKLYFDADGTGAQAQVLIATISNLATLSAGDFVVI